VLDPFRSFALPFPRLFSSSILLLLPVLLCYSCTPYFEPKKALLSGVWQPPLLGLPVLSYFGVSPPSQGNILETVPALLGGAPPVSLFTSHSLGIRFLCLAFDAIRKSSLLFLPGEGTLFPGVSSTSSLLFHAHAGARFSNFDSAPPSAFGSSLCTDFFRPICFSLFALMFSFPASRVFQRRQFSLTCVRRVEFTTLRVGRAGSYCVSRFFF